MREREKDSESREFLTEGISISTIDHLLPTSLDQLVLILKMYTFLLNKTSYLDKEVNCTEPSFQKGFPGGSDRELTKKIKTTVKRGRDRGRFRPRKKMKEGES